MKSAGVSLSIRRVERDFGLGRIKDLEYLLLVGLGVIQHLLPGQRRAGRALATRVTDHASEVTDQENDLMPKVTELAQLVDQHSMAQMQVRRSRVEARLDTQAGRA